MRLKASIKKEIMDSVRNYKIVIILATVLFFAVFDPVMNKLVMPQLFKTQFPGVSEEVIEGMMGMTSIQVIRMYLDDVFQIGTLIITFALCGLLSQEIKDKSLILPLSMGKRYGEILLAKLLLYGTVTIFSTTIGVLVNYYYTSVLYGPDMPLLLPVIRSGVLLGIYIVFVISMLIFVGAIVKKPILTGLLVLIPTWFMQSIGNLLGINRYIPSGLLDEAQALATFTTTSLWTSLISTIAVILVMFYLTTIRLSKIELTRG